MHCRADLHIIQSAYVDTSDFRSTVERSHLQRLTPQPVRTKHTFVWLARGGKFLGGRSSRVGGHRKTRPGVRGSYKSAFPCFRRFPDRGEAGKREILAAGGDSCHAGGRSGAGRHRTAGLAEVGLRSVCGPRNAHPCGVGKRSGWCAGWEFGRATSNYGISQTPPLPPCFCQAVVEGMPARSAVHAWDVPVDGGPEDSVLGVLSLRE